MAIGANPAAKLVCERSSWQISNLALQKILYIAHMVHMGRTKGARLINGSFEAWDYGPVLPDLYHRVKIFGDRPIQDIFFSAPSVEGSQEAATIIEACDHFLQKKPGELVALTHDVSGAWYKNYRPGVRGIVIPDEDILDEYRVRIVEERAE